jgi:L-lactate dehydrogenase
LSDKRKKPSFLSIPAKEGTTLLGLLRRMYIPSKSTVRAVDRMIPDNHFRPPKVAVVGVGFVGSTFAYTLMTRGLSSEIVLIDVDKKRAEGEAMDLNHGLSFVRPVRIWAGDCADCKDADIIVVSAGAAQKPDEKRLELVQRNFEVFKDVVPKITKHNRNGIFLIATNTVDIMTYATLKLSGFPAHRVIGSGTILDTSRLRYMLGEHLNIDPRNVHAYIIGEHDDSEVPVWSLANVAGTPLKEFCAEQNARLDAIHHCSTVFLRK